MTKAVNFRKMEMHDAHLVYKWRRQKFIDKKFPSDKPTKIIEHEKWMRDVIKANDKNYWIILDKGKKECGLFWIEKINNKNLNCEFGFYIGEKNKLNSGIIIYIEYFIITYCFDKLKMNKIYCECMSNNKKVISFHKRFGFKNEGIFLRHIKKNNRFYDIYFMSLFKKNFKKELNKIKKIINELNFA